MPTEYIETVDKIVVPHSYIQLSDKHTVFNFYCATPKETEAVKHITQLCDAKYFICEARQEILWQGGKLPPCFGAAFPAGKAASFVNMSGCTILVVKLCAFWRKIFFLKVLHFIIKSDIIKILRKGEY